MNEYIYIKNEKDAQYFIEQCNGLHDGYITSFQYQNDGIVSEGNCTNFDFTKSKLTMQVLVTSHIDKITVEMVFEGILEWQICHGSSDIFGCIFETKKNSITWADSYTTEWEIMRECSFVQAISCAWRIIE